MMASVKVLGQPVYTDVARVLACLFEKNVEFQLVRMDAFNKDNHKMPEFLRLQDPSGQVTFNHGDTTRYDSRDICKYICETFADQGNKKLLGPGALEKACIKKWLQTEAKYFNPPSSALIFHLAFAEPMGMTPDTAVIEKNEKKLNDVLDYYEQRLQQSKFLAGNEFSLADLSHLPNAHYLVNKSKRGYAIFAKRKNVFSWWKEISGRPSWKKVVQIQSEQLGPLEKFADDQ